jgi:hypothetical protein
MALWRDNVLKQHSVTLALRPGMCCWEVCRGGYACRLLSFHVVVHGATIEAVCLGWRRYLRRQTVHCVFSDSIFLAAFGFDCR